MSIFNIILPYTSHSRKYFRGILQPKFSIHILLPPSWLCASSHCNHAKHFHYTHDISRLETVAFLVWTCSMFEKIKMKMSFDISTFLKLNNLYLFNSINYTLYWINLYILTDKVRLNKIQNDKSEYPWFNTQTYFQF